MDNGGHNPLVTYLPCDVVFIASELQTSQSNIGLLVRQSYNTPETHKLLPKI